MLSSSPELTSTYTYIWSSAKGDPLGAKPLQLLVIDLDSQSGERRDRQQSLRVEAERLGGELVEIGARGQVLEVAGDGDGGGELEVGGQADGGVPAVRDDLDVMVERQPGDPPRLA